jgi:hypothetical protein
MLSSLYTTKATSFHATTGHEAALTSRQSRNTNGSVVDQGYTQRDGYRSVAYYVVGSAAFTIQTTSSVDILPELGNIWTQAQPTRHTS